MHIPFSIIAIVLLGLFMIFMLFPSVINRIPILRDLNLYQSQLSRLYLSSSLIDDETNIIVLCNSMPRKIHFQEKNENVDIILTDYGHINYGQIFYIVSHCQKRIAYIKYELRVYSFILIFLSISSLLLQLGDNVGDVSLFILIAQILFLGFFILRLMLEVGNIQIAIGKIVISNQKAVEDKWKKIEIISKICSAIAALIGLILFIIKAAST